MMLMQQVDAKITQLQQQMDAIERMHLQEMPPNVKSKLKRVAPVDEYRLRIEHQPLPAEIHTKTATTDDYALQHAEKLYNQLAMTQDIPSLNVKWPKEREERQHKSHWDALLDECRWMALDYREERRWKQVMRGHVGARIRKDSSVNMDLLEYVSCSVDRSNSYAPFYESIKQDPRGMYIVDYDSALLTPPGSLPASDLPFPRHFVESPDMHLAAGNQVAVNWSENEDAALLVAVAHYSHNFNLVAEVLHAVGHINHQTKTAWQCAQRY